MANQFSADQGVMDRTTFVDHLSKSFDVMWLRRDAFSGNLGQFFKKIPAASLNYYIASQSASLPLPPESEDTDVLPEVVPATAWKQNFVLAVYRQAIRVTDTLLRTERYGKIKASMNGLPKAAMRKVEYLRANVLNTAFTTALADGVYLISDSHPFVNPQYGTWDNAGTAATLSYTTIQELRLLGTKTKNDVNAPDPVMINKLLIPPDLEQAAAEETKSKYVAGGSLNTETQLVGSLQIIVSPYLSSTTAYFAFGDRNDEADDGLLEFVNMEPSVEDVGDATADIPIHKRVKFILTTGAMPTNNIFGNAGA